MDSADPTGAFAFVDPGRLEDGDLELVLTRQVRAKPEIGFVPAYEFEMRQIGRGEKVGWIHLRARLTPKLAQFGGHIGYEVEPAYRGRRYAARACRLLFALARRHGIDPILITCGEDNLASRRTCEIIGGRLIRTETVEIEPDHHRPTCYYHIPPG